MKIGYVILFVVLIAIVVIAVIRINKNKATENAEAKKPRLLDDIFGNQTNVGSGSAPANSIVNRNDLISKEAAKATTGRGTTSTAYNVNQGMSPDAQAAVSNYAFIATQGRG